MPPIVTGIIASLLLLINTLFWACLLFPLTFLKVIIPVAPVRKLLTYLLAAVANAWISCNSGWMTLTQKMNWTIERPDNLSRNGWYFVLSNHQSWVDILVLQHTLNRRIPLLKFFLKQELIKVPIMGAAWWALDFPFMKRYSKEYLAKHPEMKGKDLDTTRAACEKFKDMPTSVMNFLEGTRFTQKKHDETGSPFKHLLKPKAGGMAFAMSAMGDQFQSILDVTINYPDGIPTFWDFMQGKMPRCDVIVEEKPIPAELINGDYETDDSYRLHFQQWVQKLWEEKDARLEALRKGQ
jgi:1-acyl-sn-glycerol-3-phosphate acyltransferase